MYWLLNKMSIGRDYMYMEVVMEDTWLQLWVHVILNILKQQ